MQRFLVIALMVVGLSWPALAEPTLEFFVRPEQSASALSYSGSGNLNLNVATDGVLAFNAPQRNFFTALLSGTIIGSSAAFDHADSTGWFFKPGGPISIIAGVDFPGSTPDLPNGTQLFSGVLGPVSLTKMVGSNLYHLSASMSGTVLSTLLDFWGLTDTVWHGPLSVDNVAISGTPAGPLASLRVLSASGLAELHPGSAVTIPEPRAIWMVFGLLLLACLIYRRRAA